MSDKILTKDALIEILSTTKKRVMLYGQLVPFGFSTGTTDLYELDKNQIKNLINKHDRFMLEEHDFFIALFVNS